MIRDSTYILLVEDNQDDVDLTIRALKKNGLIHEVAIARDGAEALDLIFRRGDYAGSSTVMPQLILLDIRLPKLSGLEVLKELRQDERTRFLPVVMLTSSKQEQDLVDSYGYGANSYIQKPVSFDDFSEAVGQLGVYWLVLNKAPWRTSL
jgi:two-component system response regulator